MSWTIKWLDPLGVETQFTGSPDYKVMWHSFKEMSGSSFKAITQGIPLKPGSHLKNIDVEDNDPSMTVLVQGTNDADLWNKLSSLVNSFNPLIGTGVLKVTPPHGQERWLTCHCISGLRLNESDIYGTSARFDLDFLATDHPFWQSSTVFQQTASITGNPPQWFPIFPLRLGGDAVVSEFTVVNTGHVETYPLWTITGPGQNPKITNLTTGEFIGISDFYLITLESSTDKLTIDTENRIVQDQTGTSYLEILDIKSSFFALKPGSNTIRVEMPSATTDSSISLSYRLLYLGVV